MSCVVHHARDRRARQAGQRSITAVELKRRASECWMRLWRLARSHLPRWQAREQIRGKSEARSSGCPRSRDPERGRLEEAL